MGTQPTILSKLKMNPLEGFLLHYLNQPVPTKLAQLFSIEKKSELMKYAHSLEVSKEELVTLIHTSVKIGYFHFIECGESIPKHLIPTMAEKEAFGRVKVGALDPMAAKYVSKISNTFKERSYRVGHLFVGMQRWHLFFLELRDIDESGNHWRAGPHIHFTNHLCSPLGIDDVSKKFTALDFDLGQRLHIRWKDDENSS